MRIYVITFFFCLSCINLCSQTAIGKKNEIGFGSENISVNKGINGGNYLYVEYLHKLTPFVSTGTKISTDLVPNNFDDFLFYAGIRFNTKLKKNRQKAFSFLYIKNLNADKFMYHVIAAKISLINYSDNSFRMQLFPLTILFSVPNNQFSYSYELIAMAFNFK